MKARFALREAPRWSRLIVRFGISAGLVALVIGLASPHELVRQLPLLPWRQLVGVTTALVVGLYLADACCVYWLFRQPHRPLAFPTVLRARGHAYLLSSLNYELGQGAMAWHLARAQGRALLSALGTCALLAFHDVVVLLTLGLLGGLLSADPGGQPIARSCALALALVAGLGIAIRWLPGRWQERCLPSRFRVHLDWWTWKHSAHLALLRTGYFALMLLYASYGLKVCGVSLSAQVICSVVPLVLLADGLPISVSGLGTREATLLYLINPEIEERAVLVAFSLLWSLGLVFGRAALGLAFWWFTASHPIGSESP